MARINGVDRQDAGWFTRLVYSIVERKMAKLTGKRSLVEPIKISAHHPRLMWAKGQMELGQDAANSVPATLKDLASIKAATMIGCPF
jgi:hypothetical protein